MFNLYMETFEVLIEIEQGSNLKYEFDEALGKMRLDFTFENLAFPFNYGFIPGTLGGDGDALDAIVLSSAPKKSGERIQCRAVGILQTLDRGEVDDKIVCVPVGDELAGKYHDSQDLPADTLDKWTEFYNEVARQKEKTIKIIGLKNKQAAEQEIKNALT